MGLFGGSSSGYDTDKLKQQLLAGLGHQEAQVAGAYNQLPALQQKYAQERKDLGSQYTDLSKQQALQYGRNLEGINTQDLVNKQMAQATKNAYRDLPANLQQTREQLAASGGLNRGAAVRALQQPVQQAAQTASDQRYDIQNTADQFNLDNKLAAVQNLYKTESGAALNQLGIDEEMAKYLVQSGQENILNRANALIQIEGQRTQGLLDIEQLRQQQEAQKSAASKARLGQVLGLVGTAGGAGIGAMFGGAPGASIGSQFGSQLGSAAGGGQANLQPAFSDLASLLASRSRTPGVTSLGSRGSVNTNARYPGQKV